ncbi:hypothetical protein [Cellulomonas sp. P5_C6]
MSMDSSQLGLLLGVNVAQREADSARPWAPEVAEPEPIPRVRRTRAPRTRRTLAGALHHLADAVAPACTTEAGHPAR